MADLPQPQDIPWQPLCVSQDMMDPVFCNHKFPIAWRSSLAIAAYETDPTTLPVPFCAGKLTYVKITATITGYQPTDQELTDGYVEFGNTPVEAILDDIFDTYFGCYGALLNVAVFPNSTLNWKLPAYPKIFEFEPKNRDLIQTSTEAGEVLTASKNDVSTGHSFTSTNSSTTGISGNATFGNVVNPAEGATANQFGGELGFTQEWGQTQEDSSTVSSDASTERSETQSTTTNIEQMYNLLSGYHTGTNRAVLFMLPRPHLLQPTNRRTFAQGLRIIEGIQEFFFIVVRDPAMEGICIEARLDTGHYPENIQIQEPELQYETSTADFVVQKHANSGINPQVTQLDTVYTVPSGWVVDTRVTPPGPFGDSGHIGIHDTDIGSNSQGAPVNYNYQAISPTQVFVSGHIQGAGLFGPGAIFNHKYTVFLRSEQPKPSDIGDSVDIGQLFTTSRNLCCCFHKVPTNPCLTLGKLIAPFPSDPDTTYTKILSQRNIKIPKNLLEDMTVNKSLEPAVKALLKEIKNILITSRSGKFNYTDEDIEITFLDSDYFVSRILPRFPLSVQNRLLSAVPGLDPLVLAAFGPTGTIKDALSLDLAEFMMKTRVDGKISKKDRRLMMAEVKNP
ncbi:MAG: hypothetical protein WC389_14105 [Lutibacter sp.]|jgi:hypothetical protein